MKKMTTVIYDEDGTHEVDGDENKMCPGCNSTVLATEKICRNCREVIG